LYVTWVAPTYATVDDQAAIPLQLPPVGVPVPLVVVVVPPLPVHALTKECLVNQGQ
jgi:hypothetical protein